MFIDASGVYEVLENKGASGTVAKGDGIQPIFDIATHPIAAWLCVLLAIAGCMTQLPYWGMFVAAGALSRLCAGLYRCSRLDPFWPPALYPAFPEDQRL